MQSLFVGLHDDHRNIERRAAQVVEEVIGGTHLLLLQHAGKDAAEGALHVVGRLLVVTVGGLYDGGGQHLAVHLLVLVQRDAVNLHRRGRNHVRWFLLSYELVQLFHIHRLAAHHVCRNELSARRAVKGLHRSVADAGELAYDGLNLLQFYAEAAYLHLSVPAPHELYIAVGQVAHNVAGAITAGK